MAGDQPSELDRALIESGRRHDRSRRRSRHSQWVRNAALIAFLAAGPAVLWIAWAQVRPSNEAHVTHVRLTADLGSSLGQALAEGAVPLCVDGGTPATVRIPPELRPIQRVALASLDLTTTLWEVHSEGGSSVEKVEIGRAPTGFDTVRAFSTARGPASGLIVVNNSNRYGLAALSDSRHCA